MLTEIKNDLRELIMPALGLEIPLAISQVNEALSGEDKRPQLHKKKKTALGWDFWYSLPPNMCFKDFASKKEYFRDAIGTHCTVEVIHSGKLALLRVVTQQLKDKYLYDWDYDRSGGELVIPIGHTHDKLLTVALESIPHILVAGITRSGKSNFIHTTVNSLLLAPAKPDIILIDLKMSEYNYLEDYLMLVTDRKGASQTLSGLVSEMRKRQRLLKASKCVNIAKYNAKHSNDPLKYIVLIIDELAELDDEDAQEDTETLLRLCAASGICILAATQRPDAQTFKHFGQSKANFLGRLCYQVADSLNSNMVLGNSMAAELPAIRGRAIWRIGRESIEVQTPYLDPEEAEAKLS